MITKLDFYKNHFTVKDPITGKLKKPTVRECNVAFFKHIERLMKNDIPLIYRKKRPTF